MIMHHYLISQIKQGNEKLHLREVETPHSVIGEQPRAMTGQNILYSKYVPVRAENSKMGYVMASLNSTSDFLQAIT